MPSSTPRGVKGIGLSLMSACTCRHGRCRVRLGILRVPSERSALVGMPRLPLESRKPDRFVAHRRVSTESATISIVWTHVRPSSLPVGGDGGRVSPSGSSPPKCVLPASSASSVGDGAPSLTDTSVPAGVASTHKIDLALRVAKAFHQGDLREEIGEE